MGYLTEGQLAGYLGKLPSSFGLILSRRIALIRCPDHKRGKEEHPSMRINLETNTKHRLGSGHCFVCGAHYGSWQTLYARLTGKAAPDQEYERHYSGLNKDGIMSLLEPSETFDPKHFPTKANSLPWSPGEIWRNIDGKLLADIGAVYFDRNWLPPSIFLPNYVHGTLAGGINANLKKNGKQNYFNTPGDWASITLFPYDYTAKLLDSTGIRWVVLVEGPRDALHLLQYGIPALSTLGTGHTVNPIKYMLLDDLEIEGVIKGFDADKAGRKASRDSGLILDGYYKTRKLKMKEGDDPARLPPAYCKKLLSKMEQLSGV